MKIWIVSSVSLCLTFKKKFQNDKKEKEETYGKGMI